jgi:hypothetical protein
MNVPSNTRENGMLSLDFLVEPLDLSQQVVFFNDDYIILVIN